MKNKKQDRALQAPAEANRDKHMNYLAAEEQNENAGVAEDQVNKEEENEPSSEENIRNKRDAESGNDGSTNQMLQQENLIDPGNEHNHLREPATNRTDDYRSKKFDADAGGDGTGTMGSKPGE